MKCRRLPTKINKEIRKTRELVTKTLTEIIQERRRSVESGQRTSYGDDLLGVILTDGEAHNANSKNTTKCTDEQLVDQCRTFFFAGHDTVQVSIAWTLVLLAHYPEWQDRIRQEVFDVLGHEDVELHAGTKLHKFNLVSLLIAHFRPASDTQSLVLLLLLHLQYLRLPHRVLARIDFDIF